MWVVLGFLVGSWLSFEVILGGSRWFLSPFLVVLSILDLSLRGFLRCLFWLGLGRESRWFLVVLGGF